MVAKEKEKEVDKETKKEKVQEKEDDAPKKKRTKIPETAVETVSTLLILDASTNLDGG